MSLSPMKIPAFCLVECFGLYGKKMIIRKNTQQNKGAVRNNRLNHNVLNICL